MAAEDQAVANIANRRKVLEWFFENDRPEGWTQIEFEHQVPKGFAGGCYWKRISELRVQERMLAVVDSRVNPETHQPQMASRITEIGCKELERPVLADLPVAPLKAARPKRYTRARFADELEVVGSPLCDCRPDVPGREPSNFITKILLSHHCNCAAVLASRVVRRGEEPTLHERACTCGERHRVE